MEKLLIKIIVLIVSSLSLSSLMADPIETNNDEIINRALQYYLVENREELIREHDLISSE